ncbi:MAG: hypothetical protein O2819_02725 [Planctomycetota bacterium]|nr:hypothetical protein [Planctomycetota bacterium]
MQARKPAWTDAVCVRRAWVRRCAPLILIVLIPSCRGVEPLPDAAREVTAAAFAGPVERPNPAPPAVKEAGNDAAEPGASGEGSAGSGGSMRVGRRWVVDALIGQINGRPLYAGEFLDTLEDRILRLAVEQPDEQARLATAQLVSTRLEQYVDNELILAEAEQQLSPEMRIGLLSFLQQIRENTIAGYGGTRFGAESSISELYGMSLDAFVNERKNEALAMDLLRKRVQPRVVVAWRDVELAFARLRMQQEAAGRVSIGRIRLPSDDPRVGEVTAALEGGATFADIAARLGLERGGQWNSFDLPEAGLSALEVADDIRMALVAAGPGSVTAPITRPTRVEWYCVLEVTQPSSISLWDPVVQLAIRSELESMRWMREKNKYLYSLRDRWISSDFDEMRRRLVAIAIQRYFPE